MFVDALCSLGENWTVDDELIDKLEEFTCKIYGSKQKQLNEARTFMLRSKCGSEKLDASTNFTWVDCHHVEKY